jgi:hypothetical protein
MARLSNVQIYAIRWLHSQNTTLDKIVSELDLTEKQILNTLEKFAEAKTEATDQEIRTASEQVSAEKTTNPKNLMITQTSGKNTPSVAIMTQAASELADEMKKNMTTQQVPDHKRGIFRPNSK